MLHYNKHFFTVLIQYHNLNVDSAAFYTKVLAVIVLTLSRDLKRKCTNVEWPPMIMFTPSFLKICKLVERSVGAKHRLHTDRHITWKCWHYRTDDSPEGLWKGRIRYASAIRVSQCRRWPIFNIHDVLGLVMLASSGNSVSLYKNIFITLDLRFSQRWLRRVLSSGM
jgi:hypothetical protein